MRRSSRDIRKARKAKAQQRQDAYAPAWAEPPSIPPRPEREQEPTKQPK